MDGIKTTGWVTALFLLAAVVQMSASAATRERPPADTSALKEEGPHWFGDIRDFAKRDFPYWRKGYWVRDIHEGRGGWWWVVGSAWYPYPQVVYPYPDPYTPPEHAQPTVIEQNVTREQPEPNPPFYWFYCESVDNYYPYVISCEEGWVAVQAQG